MPNLEETTIPVQDQSAPGANASPEAQLGANGETTPDQSTQEDIGDGKLGPDNLPPELEETRKQLMRDYHAKTQKIRDQELRLESTVQSLQDKGNTLDQLMGQEWFKEAMQRERARREGRAGLEDSLDIPDDELAAAIDNKDKKAFVRLVGKVAQQIVSGQVAPKLSQAESAFGELKAEHEFESVAGRKGYEDFRDVHGKGLLDPYLNAGHSFEDAYKLYRADVELPRLRQDLEKKAQEKAQEILNASRDGAVSRGGGPVPKGQQIIKAGSFEDAFDKAWDLMKRGAKAESFTIEREEKSSGR